MRLSFGVDAFLKAMYLGHVHPTNVKHGGGVWMT